MESTETNEMPTAVPTENVQAYTETSEERALSLAAPSAPATDRAGEAPENEASVTTTDAPLNGKASPQQTAKRGAQAGNTNAVRHGARGTSLGAFKFSAAERGIESKFYRWLQLARSELGRNLSFKQENTLLAAARMESVVLRVQRRLRVGGDKIDNDEFERLQTLVDRAEKSKERLLGKLFPENTPAGSNASTWPSFNFMPPLPEPAPATELAQFKPHGKPPGTQGSESAPEANFATNTPANSSEEFWGGIGKGEGFSEVENDEI